jgi:hypothetical protein
MTTFALLNEPRCLDLESFSLAAPRPVREPGVTSRCGWDALKSMRSTATFRKDAARECLDTLAVLRAYREPLPGEVWTLPLGSERRMLAQVNAILTLGQEALKQAADLAIDADLPDPGRVFASLFVLGCVAGSAWREPILNIFVTAVQRNPAEGAAAIEALSLAPNVGVLEGLSGLLSDERPKLRSAAIRVLSFRGALAPSQWGRVIEDEDGAVAMAAACAPVGAPDRERCRTALERLLYHRSEGVVCAALRAGFALRLEAAHHRASEIVRHNPAWADALQYLSMFGQRSDESTIRDVLAGPQWLLGIRAAALSGRAALVPELLALVPPGEATPAQRGEIACALTTITGLPFEAVEDRVAAEALWTQNRDRFDPLRRYRHGQQFQPLALLSWLRLVGDANAGSRAHLRESRQQAYLELIAATDGRVPPFSAYDFVARQCVSLQRIDSWLAMSTEEPWAAGPLH